MRTLHVVRKAFIDFNDYENGGPYRSAGGKKKQQKPYRKSVNSYGVVYTVQFDDINTNNSVENYTRHYFVCLLFFFLYWIKSFRRRVDKMITGWNCWTWSSLGRRVNLVETSAGQSVPRVERRISCDIYKYTKTEPNRRGRRQGEKRVQRTRPPPDDACLTNSRSRHPTAAVRF